MRTPVITTLLCLLFLESNRAQITSSPYTMFGAGQVEDKGFGINKAMGGTGIAFQSVRSLNNINPASYSGIDSLAFLLELGVFGKQTWYSSHSETQSKFDGNLRYMALGFRITRWWATSLGIVPFSAVGYRINSTDQIEGELTQLNKLFTGTGGINQFYCGNSFKIFRGLTAGMNASYFLGSVTQAETAGSSNDFSGFYMQNTERVHSFYLDYGLQYTIKRNHLTYTLGIIYGNKKKLSSTSNSTFEYLGDTTVVSLESSSAGIRLPEKFGLGLAICYDEKLRVGIDYERRNWDDMKFTNPLLATRNSNRYSLGIEYSPGVSSKDILFEKLTYRLGVNYQNSYLTIDGTPVNSGALSFGLGVPLKNNNGSINFSFEVGQNGTTNNGLIKEKYWLAHLSFTLNEIWFQKPKYH